MGRDERRWLFALSRGRLSEQAIAKNMPRAVRDSLQARGFVGWADDSLGLTTRGQEALAQLRSRDTRTADGPAAQAADAGSKSAPGHLDELQLQWLENALSRRFRGEALAWSTIPDSVRAPLERNGLIWRYEDSIEINLSAVRVLAQHGIRWRPV